MARVPGAPGRRKRWSVSRGPLLLVTSLGVTLSSAAFIGALAFAIGRRAIGEVAIEFGGGSPMRAGRGRQALNTSSPPMVLQRESSGSSPPTRAATGAHW
ncbi:MAG: hypothetical protein WCQ50_02615 [Spirochaetota bacterium]